MIVDLFHSVLADRFDRTYAHPLLVVIVVPFLLANEQFVAVTREIRWRSPPHVLPPLGLPLVPPICSPSPGPLPRLPVVYFVKIIIKSLLVLVSFFAIVFNSVCTQL